MAAKTLITLEEFDALPDDGFRHEINRGELITVTLPMPRHNRVIRRILRLFERYLDQNPVGEMFLPDTPYILSLQGEPVTLRGPDLTFISRTRLAALDEDRGIQGAAELTIEVVTPSDTSAELMEKVAQYLKAGGKLVWVVYPKEREVRVFEASGAMRILDADDAIGAPDLLPGFSARVAGFFE
jgi:Uma2 family endonuclease